MKPISLSYMGGLIVFFVLGAIPFFQNLGGKVSVILRGGKISVAQLYLYTSLMGMIQGIFLILLIKSLLLNLKKTKLEKFDLGDYNKE